MQKRKIKNIILKGINLIMAALFVLSITAIDSPSRIPVIVAIICEAWFLLFMLANHDMEFKGE